MLSNFLMVETDSGRTGFDYLKTDTSMLTGLHGTMHPWVPFQKGERSLLWARTPLATYLSESTLDTVV